MGYTTHTVTVTIEVRHPGDVQHRGTPVTVETGTEVEYGLGGDLYQTPNVESVLAGPGRAVALDTTYGADAFEDALSSIQETVGTTTEGGFDALVSEEPRRAHDEPDEYGVRPSDCTCEGGADVISDPLIECSRHYDARRAAKVAEEIRLIEQHRDFMREHGL